MFQPRFSWAVSAGAVSAAANLSNISSLSNLYIYGVGGQDLSINRGNTPDHVGPDGTSETSLSDDSELDYESEEINNLEVTFRYDWAALTDTGGAPGRVDLTAVGHDFRQQGPRQP